MYKKGTQGNFKMFPLWAIALYIQVYIIYTIRQWEKGGFPLNTLICCIEVPSKAGLTVHKMENFINSIFCIETILLNFNIYICSLINIQNIPHYINQAIIHAYQRRSQNCIHLNIFFKTKQLSGSWTQICLMR